MLSISDLIHLPYTPDLTEGGIAYALRSLPYSFERIGSKPYDGIRRTIANVAVELAFRRYLSGQEIPFEVESGMPFTEPDKYHVTLGRRRCDIKSFFISNRSQVAQIRKNPSVLLNAPALVPSDHHASHEYSDKDLYLFAFLCGEIASSQADIKKAIETNQPHYLIHVMPTKWRKPTHWNPLGTLTLKSESSERMLVEVNGQGEGRDFVTRLVNLPAKTRVTVKDPFYSISSIHIKNKPTARLGIHSPSLKEAHVISSLDWGNIWVYGMDIYLAGFISRGEFRRRAKMILPNSRVFQYSHTKTKSLAVPIMDLSPLQDLFEKSR